MHAPHKRLHLLQSCLKGLKLRAIVSGIGHSAHSRPVRGVVLVLACPSRLCASHAHGSRGIALPSLAGVQKVVLPKRQCLVRWHTLSLRLRHGSQADLGLLRVLRGPDDASAPPPSGDVIVMLVALRACLNEHKGGGKKGRLKWPSTRSDAKLEWHSLSYIYIFIFASTVWVWDIQKF